jgi:(p)ppGpp synthase/HD superfamily hydrolase
MYDPARRIDVDWSSAPDGDPLFDIKLVLHVEDRQGMLAKIISVVSGEKTNIKNVEAETFDAEDAKIRMVLAVADRKQMERVIRSIRRIRGVREVERILR